MHVDSRGGRTVQTRTQADDVGVAPARVPAPAEGAAGARSEEPPRELGSLAGASAPALVDRARWLRLPLAGTCRFPSPAHTILAAESAPQLVEYGDVPRRHGAASTVTRLLHVWYALLQSHILSLVPRARPALYVVQFRRRTCISALSRSQPPAGATGPFPPPSTPNLHCTVLT